TRIDLDGVFAGAARISEVGLSASGLHREKGDECKCYGSHEFPPGLTWSAGSTESTGFAQTGVRSVLNSADSAAPADSADISSSTYTACATIPAFRELVRVSLSRDSARARCEPTAPPAARCSSPS